jgi:beta-xylosidase
MKKTIIQTLSVSILLAFTSMPTQAEETSIGKVNISYTELDNIGWEKSVMRRDPSDIIKVGDLYYLWYSKGTIAPGYDATIWSATSPNGLDWTEQGMALDQGEPGTWEGASVFTPNILVAEGRYWLFYTGTSNDFHKKPFKPDSKIGIAVSDSPDGPWERLATNPALTNSDDPAQFDSHLIDDACLLMRDGKYWLYYKGRQLGKKPAQTKMGVAIADQPEGPYVKYENNPIIQGNHEVMVWTQGEGVAAMIGTTGPKNITNSILYAEDGLNFVKTHKLIHGPVGAGAYRRGSFTDKGEGGPVEWGVELQYPIKKQGGLVYIQRWDAEWASENP